MSESWNCAISLRFQYSTPPIVQFQTSNKEMFELNQRKRRRTHKLRCIERSRPDQTVEDRADEFVWRLPFFDFVGPTIVHWPNCWVIQSLIIDLWWDMLANMENIYLISQQLLHIPCDPLPQHVARRSHLFIVKSIPIIRHNDGNERWAQVNGCVRSIPNIRLAKLRYIFGSDFVRRANVQTWLSPQNTSSSSSSASVSSICFFALFAFDLCVSAENTMSVHCTSYRYSIPLPIKYTTQQDTFNIFIYSLVGY